MPETPQGCQVETCCDSIVPRFQVSVVPGEGLKVVCFDGVGRYLLLPTLNAERLSLENGPDPPADEPVGDTVELAVVANVAGTHDLPGLLVNQQQIEILRCRLAEGTHVVVGGGVPGEALVPVLSVVPRHPGGPSGIQGREAGLVEVLQDKVPLGEAERVLALPLGASPPSVVELDAEAPGEVLVLGLAVELLRLELAPAIGEEAPRQPPLPEGRVEHHEDVDLVLVEEPAPRQEEAAVIILHQNEQQVPEEREGDLALDIDLPEVIRCGGLEPPDRLDRGLAHPLQMVLHEDLAHRLGVNRQAQEIPDEAGTSVRPIPFRLHNQLLSSSIDFPVVTAPAVIQTRRPGFEETLEVAVDGPQGHPKSLCRLSLREQTSQYRLDEFFSRACVALCRASAVPPSPAVIHFRGTIEIWNFGTTEIWDNICDAI